MKKGIKKMKLKLVYEDGIRKRFEGYGYEVVFEQLFEELPMAIKIRNIGMDKLRKPSFICDENGNLVIFYNNMIGEEVTDDMFGWVDEVKEFIKEFNKIKEGISL